MSDQSENVLASTSRNVLGGVLQPCCFNPVTGFFRDGFCHVDSRDLGVHSVCVEVTDDFLQFSAAQGNDLSTPRPEFDFPGLSEGDRWCLCAARWLEAYHQGVAPRVYLESCHEKSLEIIDLNLLKSHAVERVV